MGAIKWDWEGASYTATIDCGLGGDSNIVLHDCKIDHFKIEAQNGGSVVLTFRIIAPSDSEDVGATCEFMARDIDLMLTATEVKTPHELFGEDAPKKVA